MHISIFCAFYYLLSIQYYVIGQDEEESKTNVLKRYVVEQDFKPPIFGSYKYDPVKQMFVIDEAPINATETPTTVVAIEMVSTSSQPGLLFLRNGTGPNAADETALRKGKLPGLNQYTAMNWKGNVKKFH